MAQLMHPAVRVVTVLPLEELWNEIGPIPAHRIRDIDADIIRALLREGPLQFVVADIGKQLRWTDPAQRFQLGKTELGNHLCRGERVHLEDYPGGYCYVASEWRRGNGEPIVVLEMRH